MKKAIFALVVGIMLVSGINSYAWGYNYKSSQSHRVEKKFSGWGSKVRRKVNKIIIKGKLHTKAFKRGYKTGRGYSSRSASNGARARQAVENTKSALRGFFKALKKRR